MPESPEGGGTSRLLGRQDLHVHTTMSDGDLTLDEVVAIGRQLQIEIGIADHVSLRNPRLFVSDRQRLESYISALDAAPVLRSAEFCWCDRFSMESGDEFLHRFDYLIGSNHGFALPDGSFASPWWTSLPPDWKDRPEELMEVMVHNLCDMVASMPIDIAAHSTFVPLALTAIEREAEAWWTPEREDRFIEAAIGARVALEISNRYRLPHQRFLMKARQAGARFTLGSDAHHVHQVARLDWAIDAAVAAGIGDGDLFVPERRG